MADLIIHVVPFVLYMLCGLKVADKIVSSEAFWETIRSYIDLQSMSDKQITITITIGAVITWPVLVTIKAVKWITRKRN